MLRTQHNDFAGGEAIQNISKSRKLMKIALNTKLFCNKTIWRFFTSYFKYSFVLGKAITVNNRTNRKNESLTEINTFE